MITYFATEKYIIIDRMSFNVVIKGPVARAGSIFNFSNTKGIIVPKRDAQTITISKDKPTVIPMYISCPINTHIVKIIIEHIIPLKDATADSFIILFKILFIFNELFAIA